MKPQLQLYLLRIGACGPAIDWVFANSYMGPQELWGYCDRCAWMVWYLDYLVENTDLGSPEHRRLVAVVCELLMVLGGFWADDKLAAEVLASVRAWAECSSTADQFCPPEGMVAEVENNVKRNRHLLSARLVRALLDQPRRRHPRPDSLVVDAIELALREKIATHRQLEEALCATVRRKVPTIPHDPALNHWIHKGKLP